MNTIFRNLGYCWFMSWCWNETASSLAIKVQKWSWNMWRHILPN